jgi:hypothetical protein
MSGLLLPFLEPLRLLWPIDDDKSIGAVKTIDDDKSIGAVKTIDDDKSIGAA